jgi:site-specific recombinase XerD
LLEDMGTRGLRQDTQRDYIRFVRSLAEFLRRPPDTATAEDIRRFQVHQAETGVQPQSINCSVSALRFFFTVTLDRPDLSRRFILVRYPRKLPTVLSVGEEGRRRWAARQNAFDADQCVWTGISVKIFWCSLPSPLN